MVLAIVLAFCFGYGEQGDNQPRQGPRGRAPVPLTRAASGRSGLRQGRTARATTTLAGMATPSGDV